MLISAKQSTVENIFLLSRLFRLMGYNGWVILIDETQVIGP